MNEQNYTKELEEIIYKLISMLTDHSLYSFLSEMERKKLSEILQNVCSAKEKFKAA